MQTTTLLIEKIQSGISLLVTDYNIKEMAIFGSYARGENTENSDIDILISYYSPIGLKIVDLKIEIEYMLNLKVDIVNSNSISEIFYDEIKSDLIYVYKEH